VQPVELARKLAKEMDDGKTVSLSRVYAPNEYRLYLSPRDRDQFRGYEQSLLDELAGYLAEHARREGYALVTAPRVLLEEDPDLSVGEFGIATRLVQQPAAEPAPAPLQAPPSPPPAPAPPAPVVEPRPLEAGGTRVFPAPAPPEEPVAEPVPAAVVHAALAGRGTRVELDARTVVLGRAKDCDVVLDDPSVSRRHAEVRLKDDGHWVVDLGSTNGTEVNGQRVQEARLDAGDVITIGQTELRFERAGP
jgi:hypothetical protein